jgi:hypothetical protein
VSSLDLEVVQKSAVCDSRTRHTWQMVARWH